MLDVSGRGFITPSELRDYLYDLGLRVTMDEAYLVFEKVNVAGDGQLKYSEFSEAFMPLDP